jgi:hypothetical protein
MFGDGVRVRRDFESSRKLQTDREQSLLRAVARDHRDFGARRQPGRAVAPFQVVGRDHDVLGARRGRLLRLFVEGECERGQRQEGAEECEFFHGIWMVEIREASGLRRDELGEFARTGSRPDCLRSGAAKKSGLRYSVGQP